MGEPIVEAIERFQGEAHRFAVGDVDARELASLVGEAFEARNGRKVILSRCAPRSARGRQALVVGSETALAEER